MGTTSILRRGGLEGIANQVCGNLVAKGLLKSKPSFIRMDREKKICDAFRKTGLDVQKLSLIRDHAKLETLLLDATSGEACAWVHNVTMEFLAMFRDGDSLKSLEARSCGYSADKTAVDDLSPRSVTSVSTVASSSGTKHVTFSIA